MRVVIAKGNSRLDSGQNEELRRAATRENGVSKRVLREKRKKKDEGSDKAEII